MIAAVANFKADGKGLNWPRVVAPFEVVVINAKGLDSDARDVYDLLRGVSKDHEEAGWDKPGTGSLIDVILDDRTKDMAWKLNDADLIGYPIIVVLGRSWKQSRKCEVQCRQLNSLKEEVPVEEVCSFVTSLLDKI